MNYEEEIIKLNKKIDALNRSFLQNSKNQTAVTDRSDQSYNKIPQVDSNTQGIAENSEDITETQIGLADTYEETLIAITNVETALAEVYEMILPPEETPEE